MQQLLTVISKPYTHTAEQEKYTTLPEISRSLSNFLWDMILDNSNGPSMCVGGSFLFYIL